MARTVISIEMDNAAFDIDPHAEVARILHDLADRMADGNRIGQAEYYGDEYDIFETRTNWLRNEPFYSGMPGLKLAKEHAEFFGCTHITGPNGTIARGPDNKWRNV